MNDENKIWKGRRRKLSQTSLILIPVPADNQDKHKKRLMSIEYRYQGYQCGCNDVKFGDAVPNIGFLASEGTENEEKR